MMKTLDGISGRARVARRMRRNAALHSTLLAALLAATLAAGCSRSRYEPLKEDSTAVVSADTLAAMLRSAQEAWDSGDGEHAAELTARVVTNDLSMQDRGANPSLWQSRAEALLDSLGFGAEYAAGGGALMMNLFSRANPQAGSWPWVVWRDGGRMRLQRVEGSGLKLAALAGRGLESLAAPSGARAAGEPGASVPPGIAALFSRRGGMGGQPTLYRWRRGAKGNWEIAQTLGPDSLGRFGTGSFSDAGGVTELVVNAYGPTPRFDECSTCPHVFWVRSFEWRDEGFVRIEERLVPSPYATFVRFVTALATNDLELARSRTDDPGLAEEAIRLGLTQPRGLWRVAPATDESAHEMVFMRGKAEAYRVNFTEFGDDWVITAITATANVIE